MGADISGGRQSNVRKSEALLLAEQNAEYLDPQLVETHLGIQFAEIEVAGIDFLDLYFNCLARTRTAVDDAFQLRRAHRALNVARYFIHTLDVPGQVVECGVFRGFSVLLMCRLARAVDPDFDGAGIHAVDSFEGLSVPDQEDAVMLKTLDDGTEVLVASHAPGHFAVDAGDVRSAFADYSEIAFHKGWVPDVLASLPEASWRFVHLDLDLYAPTAGALAYFWPRLAEGGVIMNDDFASPLFPGARQALLEFAKQNGLRFQALDTGQAVLMKL